VEEQLTEAGGPKPRRIEGLDTMDWVLMDYGDFVVHVLTAEARAYYELERLWGDRPRVEWRAA
jgi:ribosome-associated protein